MSNTQARFSRARFEVRFDSLLGGGGAMVFPCDGTGCVDLDALSERGRNNYFYARAMMGRQYATPRIVPCRDSANASRGSWSGK